MSPMAKLLFNETFPSKDYGSFGRKKEENDIKMCWQNFNKCSNVNLNKRIKRSF
jgi:hypothetical protein